MKILTSFMILALVITSTSCRRDVDVASQNLSYAADNFEITRRVVFYNGITGEYLLSVIGLCSLGNDRTSKEVSITCKVGPTSYKKHFLGLSDNVTYIVEQIESAPTSVYFYRVMFKPASILPEIDFK